jgi:hypothetical protein
MVVKKNKIISPQVPGTNDSGMDLSIHFAVGGNNNSSIASWVCVEHHHPTLMDAYKYGW